MVTRAGKKLLRNTIHTVDHHNKVLEEQDMWRQWELQQGLTMMVSDDAVRSRAKYLRMKMERCLQKQESEHSKSVNIDLNKKDVESLKRMRNYWLNKLVEAEEKDPDRWGHSGFKELYPEEFKVSSSPKHSRVKSHERRRERKKRKHKKKLSKRNASSTDGSESNSDLCDDSHMPKILKRSRSSIQEDASGIGEKSNCKKQRHHSLSKPAKSKKKSKKHKSTSKKTGNSKTYKKQRHISESSVEEVWVEKTIENRDTGTFIGDSPAAVLKNLPYINSSSSDSMEDNFLSNSHYFQNRNIPGS